MKLVEAYVDGGYSRERGVGACAAILSYHGQEKEFTRRVDDQNATCNRMEMFAALLAIDSLKEKCELHIYTDSHYVYKGMTEWFRTWRGNGWKNSKGQPVENKDLWRQLDAASRKHKVYWHWIRGHDGNPRNERAHLLATTTMGGKNNEY